MGAQIPRTARWFVVGACAIVIGGASAPAHAATLFLSPAQGTATVGGTFDVVVALDAQGEPVNAVKVSLGFPADKVQLVSPSAGESIIGIWSVPPRVDNQAGRLTLEGGIPGGTVSARGVITTLTFRVKNIGAGTIRILDESRVLRHDGTGADALRERRDASYRFLLAPSRGPALSSETHPDPEAWSRDRDAVIAWQGAGGDGYSYVMDRDPGTMPDNTIDSTRTSVSYTDLEDGRHFFHIKEHRDGIWSGTSHYQINIDATPPAEFPLEIIPSARTVRRQPVVQFATTDAASGLDHYELKIIALSGVSASQEEDPLFIEAASPYIPEPLELGSYSVIVRAYDRAGNYRETTDRLRIVTALLRPLGDRGFEINSMISISWTWIWIFGIGTLGVLIAAGVWMRRRHVSIHARYVQKVLPSQLSEQLKELHRYRERYGKLLMALLIVGGCMGTPVFSTHAAPASLAPPIISLMPHTISNEEIFYAGGDVAHGDARIKLYVQRIDTGATEQYDILPDEHRQWLYRHHDFLPPGTYLVWAQAALGERVSPPSPEFRMTVEATAFRIGSTKIGREAALFAGITFLGVALILALAYFIFHAYHARRKHWLLMAEIREAESSIRRGFAVVRRDIAAELEVVKKARVNKELSREEHEREERLLRDLEAVERYVGKEIWDIERAEATP